MEITTSYYRNLDITSDPQAAATLTLAEIIADLSNCRRLDGPHWLTVDQAASSLGICRRSVSNLCRSGKLPHTRIGNGRGTIRIKPADLDKIKPASVSQKKPFQATLEMLQRA